MQCAWPKAHYADGRAMNNERPTRLNVWHGSRQVGELVDQGGISWDAEDDMDFTYSPEWLKEGFPISQSLPTNQPPSEWHEDAARRFFANLLPEENERALLVKELRVSDRDFRLLEAIGGECAGALCLLPPGVGPSPLQDGYERLTDADLHEMARRHALPKRLSGARRPRYSLAGAQPKVSVMVRNGRLHSPTGNAPSTHILKFEQLRFEGAAANEAFTMRLAAACGLGSAHAQLMKAGGSPCLLITRYDRAFAEDGEVRRLHQEDFCQATGTSKRRKYEADGGLALPHCANLLRRASASPQNDCERLVRWQAFNVLCGNADGHAKNLALLYAADGGARLAPFYDLVCTQAFGEISQDLAVSVNGVFEAHRISAGDWQRMSTACGLDRDFATSALIQMAESLPDAAAGVRDALEGEHGALPTVQGIEDIVTANCERQLRALTKHARARSGRTSPRHGPNQA